MRRFAWLLFLFLSACGGKPQYAPLPPGTPVLAFGDSVTYGTGAGEGEDYPSRLAALTGWAITNAGVPGDTAVAARGRIGDTLTEAQPRLVLVELGGNDFLRKRPEAAVKEDLRAIVAEVRRFGAQPVIVAVPRFSVIGAVTGGLPDSDIYEQLAEEELVPWVPKVFATVLSDNSLKSDQIHPNAEGYRQLASGIAERLQKLGLLPKR